MSIVRVTLVLLGTVAWPLPLGETPLGAAERTPASLPGRTVPASGHPVSTRLDVLDGLHRRIERLEADAGVLEDLVTREVSPLMAMLSEWTLSAELSAEIAIALVREARGSGIDPMFLLAVMLVENAPLDPQARSVVGAVGLMQVMPFHAGRWGCEGDDLTDPAINICHGTRILAHALGRSPEDVDRALLRYNGCVRGTNTPDCHLYPSKVRRARAGLEKRLLPPRGGGRETPARAV